MDSVHNDLSIVICADAADAIAKGYSWPTAVPPVKPIRVQKVIVVRNGTVEGNPTVDFLLEDETGQRFVFLVTGKLLKMIPC